MVFNFYISGQLLCELVIFDITLHINYFVRLSCVPTSPPYI